MGKIEQVSQIPLYETFAETISGTTKGGTIGLVLAWIGSSIVPFNVFLAMIVVLVWVTLLVRWRYQWPFRKAIWFGALMCLMAAIPWNPLLLIFAGVREARTILDGFGFKI